MWVGLCRARPLLRRDRTRRMCRTPRKVGRTSPDVMGVVDRCDGLPVSTFLRTFFAVIGRQNWGRKNTKKSCDGLTLAKNEFWRRAKSSLTSPARCFAIYDGTDREMGGRHFQRWVGCNFDLIKICGDFSSVYRFPPNSETFVSIRTVLSPCWSGSIWRP